MVDYKQFDIIWVQFPLSDKIDKLKSRPALIVSNKFSNGLDNDVMVCPITSTIRGDEFAIILTDAMVSSPLDKESELRCNKVTNIRNSLFSDKIGELLPEYHDKILEKIKSAFDNFSIDLSEKSIKAKHIDS
jgi:mRNA-degrading endonuclease toxin of MazEF toxin-antitoxin module